MFGVRRLVVASQNPSKIEGVREAWSRLFPDVEAGIQGIAVVGPERTPWGERAIRGWAEARLVQARERAPEADFWVAVEAGLAPWDEEVLMTAWVVVADREGRCHAARAATFSLPPDLRAAVAAGTFFAHWAPEEEHRRHTQGLVGVLSAGALLRRELYAQAVLLAFLPWRRPELW